MSQIAVIDYGGSNLRSVAKAIESVAPAGVSVTVSNEAATIANADRVVFPGQGAIGDCMSRLRHMELIDVIKTCIQTRPFLGICLGLQSLLESSEEDNNTECLNLVAGHVSRFPLKPPAAADGSPQKIPHMGWNNVNWRYEHPLVHGIASGTRFYFVHSYFVVPDNEEVILGTTDYIHPFVSAIAEGQFLATQFHPEKSAAGGLTLLRNFASWNGER